MYENLTFWDGYKYDLEIDKVIVMTYETYRVLIQGVSSYKVEHTHEIHD